MRKIILLIIFFSLVVNISCSKIVIRNINESNLTWPLFGYNAAHTNYTQQLVLPPLVQLWQHRASSAVGPAIVSVDQFVFYGTADGKIEGVRLQSGKRAGRFKIKNNVTATIAPHKQHLLLVRRIGQPTYELYDIKNGTSTWKRKGKGLFAEPIVVGDLAVSVDLGGRVVCLGLESGEEKWNVVLETQSHTTPAFASGLFVVADDNGTIYAIDLSGEIKWKYRTDAAIMAHAAIFDKTIYIGSTNGTFYSLDLMSGQLNWSFQVDSKIYYAAAVSPALIVFGTSGHKVYSLNRSNGVLAWTFEAGSGLSTNPVIANSVVYIGSYDKNLYALDLASGEALWQYEARGRIISNPIIVDGKLIFASQNDRLYCFGPE